MRSLRDEACIVGIGQTPYTRSPQMDGTNLTLQLRACEAAIADAGLHASQIDAILPFPSLAIAEEFAVHLGITDLRYQTTAHLGGAAPGAAIATAAMAVATGVATHVLVPGGWHGYAGPRVREVVVADVSAMSGGVTAHEFYFPYGLTAPVQWFSLMARLHMNAFGTTPEQLGAVAIACRRHAQLNPDALMHARAMTMGDYLASPMISDPFRLLDCSLEANGACALVVAAAERAADLAQTPVHIMGFAQGQPFPPDDIFAREDLFRLGVATAMPRALAMADIEREAIDFAELYDPFTFQVIHQLEEMGFCARGEGGPFVASGHIELGGDLPINTHGGLLSEGHVLGMNHFVEAVRQLRRTAGARQVEDAAIGLVTGFGDFGDGSIVILRR